MKEAYSIFLKHFREEQPVSGFKGLTEYVKWLKEYELNIHTGGRLVGAQYEITFKSLSGDNVLTDILTLMKEYSASGYSTNTEKRHDIDLFSETIAQEEKDYVDDYENRYEQYVCKWIDQNSRDYGVYRILDLEDRSEIIHAMSIYAIKVHPDYEKELSHLNGWADPKEFDIEYKGYGDYVSSEWLGLSDEIDENLIYDVYKDIQKFLSGFIVLHCSSSVYTLDDGVGMSYYVLCGYNPLRNCGEGLVIPDFDY